MARPLAVINSVAPIRVCDNGAWTDTWFAKRGAVFNVAVYPYVEVQITVFERDQDAGQDRIVLHAENYGERYAVPPQPAPWGPHPLLEATIAYMRVPDELRLEVAIHSEAPAGAGTGTSAAVTVALIGALDRLTPGQLSPHEVATAAQKVETELLHRQCGIQDQLASAYGGVNFIEMFEYPRSSVSPIQVPNPIWWELERRLLLVYLGQSHDSSAVHETVIAGLESAGPDCKALEDLRHTAALSRDALYAGDFTALGRAMVANNEAQGRLHPALIGSQATRVIEIARAHGVLGYKVNGAGGEGGSITLLTDESSARKRALVRAIEVDRPGFRSIPIFLSRRGLRVWQHDLAGSSRDRLAGSEA
jgi:D-glycero-alpha-D-manno-heptose-7-phosphate kinase